MNKKGTYSSNVILEIPKIIILVILLIFLIYLVNVFTLNRLDTQNLEASLIVDRIVYSRNCISYYDGNIDRPYPGIIDIKRFKSNILDSCIYYGKDPLGEDIENVYTAAKVTLTDIENGEAKEIYHNKDRYENWALYVGLEGAGGTRSYKETNYVLIMNDDGEITKGKLEFDVILPNS